MKSAYEIAMERLEREHGPGKVLTEAQKTRIAELDKRYEAKSAELRLAFADRMNAAATPAEYEQINAELAGELCRVEEQREKEKESVRNAE